MRFPQGKIAPSIEPRNGEYFHILDLVFESIGIVKILRFHCIGAIYGQDHSYATKSRYLEL